MASGRLVVISNRVTPTGGARPDSGGLAVAIRRMPNQLFLQAFLMIELVLKVIEETTLYYVQRLPTELRSKSKPASMPGAENSNGMPNSANLLLRPSTLLTEM